MQLPTFIIDTFTSQPFKGNPTGVCYMADMLPENTMLFIAGELNFPVTAFIRPSDAHEYAIRYFTPVTEIPACGHATLASARVVQMQDAIDKAKFLTTNGIALSAQMTGDVAMMTYPKYFMQTAEVNRQTLDSLQIHDYLSAGLCHELECLFIETAPQTLRTIQPDYASLVKSNPAIKEVVITSVSDDNEYDYLLRSFCPWIGIDEDPVTGSVHTALSGFWKDRLNKDTLKAYQASERGGELLIKAYDDKTEIGGKSVVIMKGMMEV